MAKDDESHIVCDGLKYIVEFAVLDDRTSPGKDFFNEKLAKEDQRKMRTYMECLANTGEINNTSKFTRERRPFYAFKHKTKSKQLARFPCYREGRRWIITHGFFKGAQPEWDESEFTRATAIRNQQLTRERNKGKHGQDAS